MKRTVAVLGMLAAIALAGFTTDPVQAQEEDSTSVDVQTAPRARWSVLPIIFSSPDTDFAFGVLPQYIFRLAPDSRPSSIRVDAYYTLNKQYSVQLRPRFWLRGNDYQISATTVFKEWPTDFFGIGIDTPDDAKEKFTERLLEFRPEVQRQWTPGLFAGARYNLRWGRISDVETGRSLESGTVPGSATGIASGIGLLVSWDTRDNVYFPSSGSLHQFSSDWYGGMLGSDYRFDVYTLDLRRYFPIVKGHVLAVQGEVGVSTGDPPFRILPGVGEVLRGYSSTRYIDRARVVLQAEYRVVPVWWRLGLTVFGGVADVAPRLGDLSLKSPRWAFGVGIRYLLFRDEKITIRQDFGFGDGSSGDYLDINEAY